MPFLFMIDESLYSRQLYVLGADAMQAFSRSSLLIINVQGLGQEICKNVILAGISKVYVYDPNLVVIRDLGSGFYFTSDDIGSRRDYAILNKMRELNPYVQVEVLPYSSAINQSTYDMNSEIISDDFVNYVDKYNFTIILTTNVPYKYQIPLSSLQTRFMSCSCDGLFSQVFIDFKTNFISTDNNGEPLLQGNVNDVSENGIMTMIDNERHNLEDNKRIRIYHNEQVIGIFDIKVLDPFRVELLNYKNDNTFLGCTFEEVKVTKSYNYLSLKECIRKCDSSYIRTLYNICDKDDNGVENKDDNGVENKDNNGVENLLLDLGDSKKSMVLHKCYLLKDKSRILKDEYKKAFVDVLDEGSSADNIEADLLAAFEFMQDLEIIPMVSVIGGFVAQEVLKGCSLKFTPLNQFMYFDSIECLNYNSKDYLKSYIRDKKDNPSNYSCDSADVSRRYEDYIALFGKINFEKLTSSSIFIVGAGAIGCEHLKNIVMSGMGSKSKVYLTDMDSIEQSNLNRQFLFKKNDVRRMKSEVAIREAVKMNPDYVKKRCIQVNTKQTQSINDMPNSNLDLGLQDDNCSLMAYTLKMGSETEDVFSDTFFSKLTFVANALDNIEARNYVDGRCVLNLKPLFESGTLGTKGNTQVIIPYKTESYSSSSDPPEKSIPLCTLRNFPNIIDHCIEYALSEFKKNFEDQIISLKKSKNAAGGVNAHAEGVNAHAEGKDTHESGSHKQEDQQQEHHVAYTEDFDIDACEVYHISEHPISSMPHLLNYSFSLFYNLFYVNIGKLLRVFPKDHITKEGLPFWTAPKRAPDLVEFDFDNEIHLLFIKSCTKILSQCCKVEVNEEVSEEVDEEVNEELNKNVESLIKTYHAKNKEAILFQSAKKINNTDPVIEMGDTASNNPDDLPTGSLLDENYLKLLTPVAFEKDDDKNSHIDFIYACANIRAENYKINKGTKLQVKGIAGKIIPAIATTTALISGLSVLEMYKYIFGCKFESYRNSYVALALPTITNSEPFEPIKNKYYFSQNMPDAENDAENDALKSSLNTASGDASVKDTIQHNVMHQDPLGSDNYADTFTKADAKGYPVNGTFTLWDRFEYDDMSLKCFLDMIKEKFDARVEMITNESKIIYCEFYGAKKYEGLMDKKFSELCFVKKGMKYIVLDVLYDNECEYFPYTVIRL